MSLSLSLSHFFFFSYVILSVFFSFSFFLTTDRTHCRKLAANYLKDVSKYVALRPQKRDGLSRDGEKGGGGGRKSEWLDRALRPGETAEAMDHRQNNNYVKAVGTSPLRSN